MLDTRPSSEQNAALLPRDGAQRRLPSHPTLHRRSHLLRKSESDKRTKNEEKERRTKNEERRTKNEERRTKKLTYIDVLGRGRARFALAWRVLEGAAQIAEHRLITKLVLRGTRRGFGGGGERKSNDTRRTRDALGGLGTCSGWEIMQVRWLRMCCTRCTKSMVGGAFDVQRARLSASPFDCQACELVKFKQINNK
jgi:hypothetical protein